MSDTVRAPAGDAPSVAPSESPAAPIESTETKAILAQALAASVEPLAEELGTDARFAKTRLIALDVDGTLTDGRIVYGSRAPVAEIQAFHVQDGIAILWLQRAGITVAFVTGRGCAATAHRAAELGVVEYHAHVASKGATVRELQQRLGVAVGETVAMGDDLPDLSMRPCAAVFVAPANAVAEVKERAGLVTRAGGGAGAVRELAEHVLRAQGRWQALVEAAER